MRRLFNFKSNNLSDKGYTLVELIVSMTLTALLATAVVAVMSPAGRVFKQVQTLSRAQIIADMVADALREECSDTYIEDYASVRIVNQNASDAGDSDMLLGLVNIVSDSPASGSVLIIRKSEGYCEALYSCLAITTADRDDVEARDNLYKNANGITSRAVYRLFNSSGTVALPDAGQGYLHYGYYQCGRVNREFNFGGNTEKASWIFPATRYDYTNPFSVSSYSGYTVKISFSNLTYTLAPGAALSASPNSDEIHCLERPESVLATIEVYDCSYSEQSSKDPVYTRQVLLVFAEDTTK